MMSTHTHLCVSKLILNDIGQLLAMMIIVNNQCGDFVEKQHRTYALYNSAQIFKFKVLLSRQHYKTVDYPDSQSKN